MSKASIVIVEDVKSVIEKANCLAFLGLKPELLCISTNVGVQRRKYV